MTEHLSYEIELKQREKDRQLKQRDYNTSVLHAICVVHGIEVKAFGTDHLQIKKGNRVLSYYPGTEKGLWISNPKFHSLTRKGFRIKSIQKFMLEEFVGEEEKPKGQAPAPVLPSKKEVYGDCICGGEYVKRTNNTSKSAFLGCTNYPKCKRTKQIFINKPN